MNNMIALNDGELAALNNTITLDRGELDALRELISGAFRKPVCFDDAAFMRRLQVVSKRLPERLLRFLTDFKYDPPKAGYCLLRNLEVDDKSIGPTPSHWQLETNNDNCMDLVLSLCLFSTVLGDMIGWLTQQDGRLIHDVLPIKDHVNKQLGSGSKDELWWHTEDAFHDLRGDYIMLSCLRNHDAVPTTVGRPDFTKLTRKQIDILFERNFTIRPDDSHKRENESELRSVQRSVEASPYIDNAYSVMEVRANKPVEVSVLFGNREDPYVRIDPYYMEEPESAAAREALSALIELTEEAIVEVPLSRGDCIIIDNYLAVHGRRPFAARFDGTDRWFKRINIVRDIRKCNKVLESAAARVIY